MRELGVWRSWLAHLVWDQRVLCSSHSTPTFNKNLLKISRFFLFTRRGLGYKRIKWRTSVPKIRIMCKTLCYDL